MYENQPWNVELRDGTIISFNNNCFFWVVPEDSNYAMFLTNRFGDEIAAIPFDMIKTIYRTPAQQKETDIYGSSNQAYKLYESIFD